MLLLQGPNQNTSSGATGPGRPSKPTLVLIQFTNYAVVSMYPCITFFMPARPLTLYPRRPFLIRDRTRGLVVTLSKRFAEQRITKCTASHNTVLISSSLCGNLATAR